MSTPDSPRPPSLPPEAWAPLFRLARLAGRPLERFLQIEAASGILLLLTAVAALLWANSPWASSYAALWHAPVGIRLGGFSFERSLEWVVNDGLMVIFFFLVGLEIRRELHDGELSEPRRAALPAAAALGGMIVPALIFLGLAGEPQTRSGWGIPMATDIAFAVGVLMLLGRRVPPALRVLLLALAVIDDLGAIVVIAAFYSSGVALSGLGVAAAAFAGVVLLQRMGVRAKLAYVGPGIVAWAGIYAAGIHPTIAGVILGLLTPVRAWLGAEGLAEGLREQLQAVEDNVPGSLRRLEALRREARSPAESLIEALHPWVAYGIMPLFALANAGVSLAGLSFEGASFTVASAVGAGLVVGKPIGVLLACGLMVKLGLGAVPVGLGKRHLLVLGVVAGVGFTMSIFIAGLALPDGQLLGAAKLGVLAASSLAAGLALTLGRLLLPLQADPGQAESADEAESSTEK